jgi:Tol biopolymer transport system component
MGEVYRAHDARLGRDVAIKVVPPSIASSPDALARFEREARAVAALSHQNILTLYDVGRTDGTPFAVLELLEGETLRSRLVDGPLPPRKATDIAAQVARGLAAAHEKQIVHRDLKPENIFITSSGGVKILDFGLARSTASTTALTEIDSPTAAPPTEPGTVLGTVGYMAPEQVRGAPSDYRADIFALGCVIYEMLSGQRAFKRETAAETMAAILREEPPDLSTGQSPVPLPLNRTLRRCLEKRPEERFQSARDLAFSLESTLETSSASAVAALPVVGRSRWLLLAALVLVGIAIGVAGQRLVTSAQRKPDATTRFRRLTYDKGIIRDARFTPDGRSVVYGAAWNGHPLRVFLTRTDAAESVALTLPDARLLSVSSTGELAISLGHRFVGWMGSGTLARTSLLGSAPRPMLDNVREADWAPGGSALAIVRRVEGLERLEFPIGTTLYRTSGYISHIRFSPDGSLIAFADHQLFADDAGGISVVDRSAHRRVLTTGWISIRGVAWAPGGNEIWFGATNGSADGGHGLYGVTLEGRVRPLLPGPTRYKMLDVASDGRVLLGFENEERSIEALMAGATAPIDVSLRANSGSQWIAPDGSATVISDQSTPEYETYLLRAGKAPVHLGRGQSTSLSPDGRWAVALPVSGTPILLHPTGAGESRELPNPEQLVYDNATWLDNTRLVMFGQRPGQRSRGYVQDIRNGPPKPFTPDDGSVGTVRWWSLPVSPDGTRVVGESSSGEPTIYHVDGSPREPIRGLLPGELPVQWTPDGRALLVARGDGLPWVIERLDLVTGRRTPALTIRAHDPAGLRLSMFGISPNARYYVHSYSRLLSDLFVVEGLR